MPNIIKLDQHISNMIAAGEVIERVSSVVKELVENSIDAGSSMINISLTDGGLKEIIVSDDGCGMDPVDARMALEPHATSKIKDEKDLFNISTLGFRGEALPSIVSVSQLRLKTSTRGGKGTMLVLKDGNLISQAIISHPVGTEVCVRNLFYNTPARLATLKSESQELSWVVDYVTKMAIARTKIAFKLTNNGKVLLQTFGSGDRLEVINNVYGANVCKEMVPFHNSLGNYKIFGYTSKISQTRSNKNYINIIVNGRSIRNQKIINAIVEGYRSLLMNYRYPITILEILVDPALVDVNTHPSKLEVRFSDEDRLADLIKETIFNVLSRIDLTVKAVGDNLDEDDDIDEEDNNLELHEDSSVSSLGDIKLSDFDLKEEQQVPLEEYVNESDEEEPKDEIKEIKEKFQQTEIGFIDNSQTTKSERKLPKLFYIGQLFGTYLLCQNEDEFYLIDQHAANERINYEKILKKLREEDHLNYELIVPINLTFSQNEKILIQSKINEINNLGIEIEDFGGTNIIVRKIPIWIIKGREKEFVEEIITHIIDNKKKEKYEFLDSIAKSLACKKSVKANDYLSRMEIDYILEDLEKCESPFTCPHGRPVIIKFDKYEIEKWFKRVV